MPAASASTAPPNRSVAPRFTGRVVGGLFLSAMFLYGGGSFLVVSTTGDAIGVPENAESLGQLSAGAILLLLNSVAVVTIGVLAFRVLRLGHRRTANAYLATRTVEAVLLALAPAGMLILALSASGSAETSPVTDSGWAGLARTFVENADLAYSLAMAALGVGSVFFCRALLKSGLIPRFLAVWGVVGYAIFALGSVLALLGFGVELVMSIPGGLFEVAAGSYLLVKGFRNVMPDSTNPTHSAGPTSTTSGSGEGIAATSPQSSGTR